MNRRDFLKSLSALGLYPALPAIGMVDMTVPRVVTIPVEWPGRLGWIHGITIYGLGSERKDGRMRLWRGANVVIELPVTLDRGYTTWQASPGGSIVYTNDMKLEVDPFVIAHTVVHPIDGGKAMYWGAEYINGKSVETWLPLNGE